MNVTDPSESEGRIGIDREIFCDVRKLQINAP